MPLFLQEPAAPGPDIEEWALWAILASPLVAWGIIALGGRRLPSAWTGWLAALGVGAAMVLSFFALFETIDADGHVTAFSHEWFAVGDLVVNLGVRIDGLTAVMLVVVTTVSFLVQIYSQGYMKGDPGYWRYFLHMCLFTFSMLGLVLADNLFMIFIFWELVGLCSYLLIGYWFHKPSAAAAAKKAFIVTRIGDLGLMAALFLAYTRFGTFDVAGIQLAAIEGEVSGTVVTWMAL